MRSDSADLQTDLTFRSALGIPRTLHPAAKNISEGSPASIQAGQWDRVPGKSAEPLKTGLSS